MIRPVKIQDVRISEGDNLSFSIALFKDYKKKVLFDLSIYDNILLQVRTRSDSEGDLILGADLGNGVEIDAVTDNIILIDAGNFEEKAGRYYYDIKLLKNGKIETPCYGMIEVINKVTVIN